MVLVSIYWLVVCLNTIIILESLWRSASREMRLKTCRSELRAGWPWHTRLLACKYGFSCLSCCDIHLFYWMTSKSVWTLASCANWLNCSYERRIWIEGYADCNSYNEFTSSKMLINGGCMWFVVYFCVSFSSSFNVNCFAASVLQVPECYTLVNTRTSKLGSAGHLLSYRWKQFGWRNIQWVLLEYLAFIYHFQLEVLPWHVIVAMHW